MKKGENYQSQGFTIIEVSLVLAIAGLIFLMTFIALPALQRSSRDTQRKEAVTLLVDAIKKYQSNNRGALPTTDDDWERFQEKYLDEGNFRDPSTGNTYVLNRVSCGASTGDCTGGSLSDIINQTGSDGSMLIVTQAKCAGDETRGATSTSNPRKFAILMHLEGGGLYCEDA